jgi:hypothetical protein
MGFQTGRSFDPKQGEEPLGAQTATPGGVPKHLLVPSSNPPQLWGPGGSHPPAVAVTVDLPVHVAVSRCSFAPHKIAAAIAHLGVDLDSSTDGWATLLLLFGEQLFKDVAQSHELMVVEGHRAITSGRGPLHESGRVVGSLYIGLDGLKPVQDLGRIGCRFKVAWIQGINKPRPNLGGCECDSRDKEVSVSSWYRWADSPAIS